MTGLILSAFTSPRHLLCVRNPQSSLHKSQLKLNGASFMPPPYEHRNKFPADNLDTYVQLLMLEICICFQEMGACRIKHGQHRKNPGSKDKHLGLNYASRVS